METSLLRIAEAFPDNDTVRMLATVHDSVILEVKDNWVRPVLTEIKEIMEDWDFDPQLEVEIKTSKRNWMEVQPYDL